MIRIDSSASPKQYQNISPKSNVEQPLQKQQVMHSQYSIAMMEGNGDNACLNWHTWSIRSVNSSMQYNNHQTTNFASLI